MNRRISHKRALALEALAGAYRATAGGSGQNARTANWVRSAAVRKYAKNWLLATGELPTGIHEVPWSPGPSSRIWESVEVDFDQLHVPPSVPVSEPAR